MRIAIFTSTLLAATLSASLVQAEPVKQDSSAPVSGDTIGGLTMDELEATVKESGLTYARLKEANGESIDVTSPDGYKFNIILVNCPELGEQRCESMNFMSYNFNETPNVTLKKINDWNRESAWNVRGSLHSDGTSGVVMNLPLDGGVTRAWVIARIQNYSYYIKAFADFVAGTTPAP